METATQVELKGTKRLFLKLGTCSRTMGYILNREFGQLAEPHERALDPLAGGIIQQGYQCGMLWGTSMAVGAEAYRQCKDLDKAIALAIIATQRIMESFVARTKYIDCEDITNCDWTSKVSMAKYFLSGKVFACFKLLEKWAPEAIQAAREGLSQNPEDLPDKCISCASEVAKKMGATDEEVVMVAGFAGGMGLCGDACGALGAAIWMKTLALCKETPGKSFYSSPAVQGTLDAFYAKTDYQITCEEVTGKHFETLDEHTSFIQKGGCSDLLDVLAQPA